MTCSTGMVRLIVALLAGSNQRVVRNASWRSLRTGMRSSATSMFSVPSSNACQATSCSTSRGATSAASEGGEAREAGEAGGTDAMTFGAAGARGDVESRIAHQIADIVTSTIDA